MVVNVNVVSVSGSALDIKWHGVHSQMESITKEVNDIVNIKKFDFKASSSYILE